VAAAVPPELTVFAAARSRKAWTEVAAAWEKQSGQRVVVSYAASSALAKQIEQAAPAHVFISADEDWMDYLAARKLLATGSRFDLVGNRLVLVAPRTSACEVSTARRDAFERALGDGRLAVADVDTRARRQVRQAALQRWACGPLAQRLAPGENVRAALAFVARGESPLGIVYATDARAEPRVRVVAASRRHARAHPLSGRALAQRACGEARALPRLPAQRAGHGVFVARASPRPDVACSADRNGRGRAEPARGPVRGGLRLPSRSRRPTCSRAGSSAARRCSTRWCTCRC
jgi:molybdate transport system substrate-binding protein